jgi:RecA/RadA recombinase
MPRKKTLKAADYLKAARAMKGVEDEDVAMMSDPLAFVSPVAEWVPTGSIALDRLIGGGFPVGRLTEVAGWEGAGKSTLLDQSIAEHQRLGGVAALIDTEHARDPKYTSQLGVDVKALLVAKAESIEDCFHAIERMIAIQEAFIAKATKTTVVPPMLIVWDSLGGTPTREEIEKPPEQVTMGTAKVVKRNFRRLMARLADARVALVFSNQFYQGIGPYAPPLSTYGGLRRPVLHELALVAEAAGRAQGLGQRGRPPDRSSFEEDPRGQAPGSGRDRTHLRRWRAQRLHPLRVGVEARPRRRSGEEQEGPDPVGRAPWRLGLPH